MSMKEWYKKQFDPTYAERIAKHSFSEELEETQKTKSRFTLLTQQNKNKQVFFKLRDNMKWVAWTVREGYGRTARLLIL
jgi:hypothetical protein